MANMLDLDFIQRWVKISKEELMERLVKDAVGLQKEAEENKKAAVIKERQEDPEYDISFVKDFFIQYGYLSRYFTDEEILAACQRNMAKSDLTEKAYARGHRDTYYGHYRFVGYTTHIFKEFRGNWEREVKDDASIFLVPNKYQNVCGAAAVVEMLLLQRCPWLTEYTVKIYDVNEHNDWIYIENPEKNAGYSASSLYVPFSALMEKDADKIAETHRKYWREYGTGKYDEAAEKFLAGEFVRDFLEKVRA